MSMPATELQALMDVKEQDVVPEREDRSDADLRCATMEGYEVLKTPFKSFNVL